MVKMHLLDFFDQTAKRKKGDVAVEHNETCITFEELRIRAMKLGSCLIEKLGNQDCAPVAVFLPKEIETIVANLGILYSANSFMNLDIKTPKKRIDNIIASVRPALIITESRYIKCFADTSVPAISIDDYDWNDMPYDEGALLTRRRRCIDTDPFCLINTSGSTGTPKCVVLNHRSFFDFMDASNERFHFDGTEIIGSLSPVVFDIYDFELCMMMMYGSRIILLDAMLAAFPAKLLEKVADSRVSFIFWVPSIMVSIANMNLLERIALPNLKLVWFAGEVFPTKQFLAWYDRLPDTVFANLYGPIEITLDCTYYLVEERPPESEPLPIGIPYYNTDVIIINEKDERCGIGEEGELCVRGTSLAMGYYNNPEKTRESFVQNPLNHSYPELIYRTGDVVFIRDDGNIMFVGRKDSLIKHMGYRIELGEIEHVLENQLKLVKYCCAVYRYSKKEIVLFYEAEKDISDKEFRLALSKVFPTYMIPSVYIKTDELPRNTNGKIDRLTLKEKVNAEE